MAREVPVLDRIPPYAALHVALEIGYQSRLQKALAPWIRDWRDEENKRLFLELSIMDVSQAMHTREKEYKMLLAQLRGYGEPTPTLASQYGELVDRLKTAKRNWRELQARYQSLAKRDIYYRSALYKYGVKHLAASSLSKTNEEHL